MVLAEIGTAGVISAYFFRHVTSGYSLNVSDPIEGQPVHLSYYLGVFECGLVFWLLVLLWARLHDSGDRLADIRKVAKLAKLIAPITTLNLCGCLLAPFMKLPLLVRFLVLFQVSSNLALLLIWAFLSLKEYMFLRDAYTEQPKEDAYTQQPKKRSRIRRIRLQPQELSLEPHTQQQQKSSPKLHPAPSFGKLPPPEGLVFQDLVITEGLIEKTKGPVARNVDGVGGKVDEAGGSGKGHGSGASGRDENRGRYGGNDGEGGACGGGDRGASGSGHGSGASGSGGGSEGGDRGRDRGGDRGASGSGHGSGASESGGGSEGGDRGRDRGGAGPECGGRVTNRQAFESSEIIKMSITLTAQTTGTLMGFHLIPTPSSSSKALLVVALMDQLVAYLCGVTGILLSSYKPEDSKANKIFAGIGFVCYTLGYILMIAMYVAVFVPWYTVLIVILLFGVVWLNLFRNRLKTCATEVWNYLKNSTSSIKNCIEMVFESG